MILSEARSQLFDVVVPDLSTQTNVDLFNRYCNLACERIINSGKWLGTVRQLLIAAPEEYFTLPFGFASAIAIKYVLADEDDVEYQIPIQNQWFTFGRDAQFWGDNGYWSQAGYRSLAGDRGGLFPIFLDSPYTTYYLKVTRENIGDNGIQVLVKGYDSDGDKVFTDVGGYSYEGLNVTLSSANITTSQVFSGEIYAFMKPATQGYIILDAVDVTTGGTTRIGYYAPSERDAKYRRYVTGDISTEIETVKVLAKVKYEQKLQDQDELFIDNYGALRAGIAALKYEAEGDDVRYEMNLAKAIRMLNQELKESRGGAKFSLNIDPTAFQLGNLYQGR